MAKATDKEPATKAAVLVELPVADVAIGAHQVYIEGYITARQFQALARVGEGLNGSLGVFAKAGGKMKNIHIVRCILETVADQLDQQAIGGHRGASGNSAPQ